MYYNKGDPAMLWTKSHRVSYCYKLLNYFVLISCGQSVIIEKKTIWPTRLRVHL